MMELALSGDEDSDSNQSSGEHEDDELSQFLRAAEEGNTEKLGSLLDLQPDLLERQDSDGYSALHRAAYSDQAEATALILSKGGSVHTRTLDGWTPLHSAARWNAHVPLKLLLQAGADINAVSNGGQTALHLAAEQRDCGACLRILLLHPLVHSEKRNEGGDTGLDLALRHGEQAYLFQLARPSINQF